MQASFATGKSTASFYFICAFGVAVVLRLDRSAPLNKDDDVVIVISQSGETADTLAALRMAKSQVHILYISRFSS
jgi:glucosamine 6-phosphate synthetase-like amidotransferase/phosphosugar isomerase protein